METARIAASLAIFATVSAFGQIDPNYIDSDDCTTGVRASVRNGRIYGAPADPASAKVITIDDFAKIKYPNAADSKKWPSKISPKGDTSGEGVLYRIDNLELRGQSNCHDAIRIDVGRYGEFNTQPEVAVLIPSSACVTDSFKPVIDAVRTQFTDRLSVWGPAGWKDFEKSCGGGGGDTSTHKISVVGYAFWDDFGGSSPPTLTLAPLIAIIDPLDSGGSGSNPGGGGTTPSSGGPSAPPPKNVAVNIPQSALEQPVFVGNGGDTTVKISTAPISPFKGDVALSVTSDAGPNDAIGVSISPANISSPGAGDATVTVHTEAMTFPRVYHVNVVATTADGETSTSSFAVSVVCDPPQILGVSQPKAASVSAGSKAQFNVSVVGTGPFVYQWYEGFPGFTGTPIAGATSANFTSPALNGSTSYWVRVSNACGTVDSNVAPVTVH